MVFELVEKGENEGRGTKIKMMKRIYIFFLIGLLFMACEDGRQVDVVVDSTIYIVNSDLQEIIVSESEPTYDLWLYKGGYNEESVDVTLTVDESTLTDYNSSKSTSYALMPSSYYNIESTIVKLGSSANSEYTNYTTITFNSLSDLAASTYVLPIVASCDDSDLINEDKNTVLIKVSVN